MDMDRKLTDNCVGYDANCKCSPWDHIPIDTSRHSPGHSPSYFLIPVMHLQEKKPLETLQHVFHIFWTIVPTLCCFAIARVLNQQLRIDDGSNSWLRFLVEFSVIVVPVVLSVNVANGFVFIFSFVLAIGLLVVMHRKRCLEVAQTRTFELGRHPRMLTLARSTINILTSVCILAIDFESFPKTFRKSRRYGAGLMDVGIGLFIFAMGTVSRRPRNTADIRKLLRMVMPILLLGFARTVVISLIDYHQDEHEYGRHLNAFFTLGLTKLIGTLLSAVASNDKQLVPIGIGLLAAHESMLLLGVSDFVMDRDVDRNTFLTANREGICSLPGFIAIYLISMYIGHWVQTHPTLSYNEFISKLKAMAKTNTVLWLTVLLCIFSVGIARVTCNFGYSAWILAIALTMSMLYMFVFDLALNTMWPVEPLAAGDGEIGAGLVTKLPAIESDNRWLPALVEAINRNGLVFFLLANILTGGVNIFLKPEDRSDLESVLILSGYMLIATAFVFLLYRFKIRIA